jgi:hypothetical protein
MEVAFIDQKITHVLIENNFSFQILNWFRNVIEKYDELQD